MSTNWDAAAYDRSSAPQQRWAGDVLARLDIAADATVLDVGCGTGRVTEELIKLVPNGRVLAVDQSPEMVALAQRRLGDRATVWASDALHLSVPEPVDAIVSTATFHWVRDHDALWPTLHRALKPHGQLVVQCGGRGNIARVERIISDVAPPAIEDWSPWTFAGPEETTQRLEHAGFTDVKAWLQDMPTVPEDVEEFVRTSILPAHLSRLPAEAREPFARAVLDRVQLPLDYVRLNVTARSS